MQVETLEDILNWIREFHQHLANCLQHRNIQNESKRAKLMLDYLSEHEQKLVKVLDNFQETADQKALNTWCYEYINGHPIALHDKCDKPQAQLSVDEIITKITHQHQQVIELYHYLRGRSPALSWQNLLDQLLSLEEHEAMRMSQAANELYDL